VFPSVSQVLKDINFLQPTELFSAVEDRGASFPDIVENTRLRVSGGIAGGIGG
jgi:hypothetical protein